MKIAIVGCGALGSSYGGKLQQAKQTVHFLLRSEYEHVKRVGIKVRSPQGNFHFQPKSANHPTNIGTCDLIIVSLKTTANGQLKDLITPLLHSSTAVLCLQNGLGNIEKLAEFIPTNQLLGGLCFICVNRPSPGTIVHLDHGQIVIGEAMGWPEPRTHDLATMFRNSGIPCKVTDILPQAQWEKLVWNIPFNGLGVASSLGHAFFDSTESRFPTKRTKPFTTEQLLADEQWHKTVQLLMHEIIDAANQLGFPVIKTLADKMIRNTQSMKDYRPSTVIDFELGRPMEFDSMFRLPLEKAQTTTVKIPTWERLCSILSQLASEKLISEGKQKQ
jgi:2-dehydropantoate 2-reductase